MHAMYVLVFAHYQLLQTNPRQAENFDRRFTKQSLVETPVDQEILAMEDLNAFKNFSFVNSRFQCRAFVCEP